MKLEVGQTLWWVPRHGAPCDVTVTKVGRKWVTLSNYRRVLADTLMVEADSQTRCYLDRTAHEADMALGAVWREFLRQLNPSYRAPPGMTIERIQQAAELLGINLPEEPK